MMNSDGRKRVGLALGGGAVRGLAHLGVLTVLERENFPIDYVAGTSVGAVIGAAYCAGLGVERMKDIATQIGWRNLAGPTWPLHGLFSFAKLEQWLVTLLGDLDFSELKIPFAAVATDLEHGEPVILKEERLAPAVRASCCIPGIITPIKMNGRVLVDGGVSDNLPVGAVRAMGADYVIGVDICRPSIRTRVGPFGIGLAALETLVRRVGDGTATADCLISPDLAGFSYVRFSQRDELINRGIRAAEEKLPLLQKALTNDFSS